MAIAATGFSHAAIRVTDLPRAVEFYQRVFGLTTAVEGEGVTVLAHPGGFLLGIRAGDPRTKKGDRFDESRVGLDHLALAISASTLEEAKRELDRLGVRNNGIERDALTNAELVTLYDPDGIAWELYALPDR